MCMLCLQEEASIQLDPLAGTAVLRAALLGPDRSKGPCVLLLTLHRVAGSHHSLALLGDQLAEAYAALKGGSEAQPATGLQFLDVLHWLRQPQQLQKFEPQHLFWLRQLAYAPPQLFLPYDDMCLDNAQPAVARSVTFMVRLAACLPSLISNPLHGTLGAQKLSPHVLCESVCSAHGRYVEPPYGGVRGCDNAGSGRPGL